MSASEMDALRSNSFSWPGALLLARPSKLAYETSAAAENVTVGTWSYRRKLVTDRIGRAAYRGVA